MQSFYGTLPILNATNGSQDGVTTVARSAVRGATSEIPRSSSVVATFAKTPPTRRGGVAGVGTRADSWGPPTAAMRHAGALRRLAQEDTRAAACLREGEQIAAQVVDGISEFRPQLLANTAWALAKIVLLHAPLMDAIQAEVRSRISTFKVTDISKVTWSMARLLSHDLPMYELLASAAAPLFEAATTQEIASIAWAVAKVRFVHVPLQNAISEQAVLKACEFQTQSCSNLLWSVGRLQWQDKTQLLQTMSTTASRLIEEFNRQDLTNSVWALAQIRCDDLVLLESIANRSISIVSCFHWQDLANASWSFAKLSVAHIPLFNAMTVIALQHMANADPQNIANLSWSLATLKMHNRELMDAMGRRMVTLIPQFEMQEIANTIWAMAHLLYSEQDLLKALTVKALTSLRSGNVQNLTNTVWACAQLKYKNTTLFNAIAREVIFSIEHFRDQDLSIVAWAYARMESRDEDLLDTISEAALKKISDFHGRPQQIANLSWAMAVLDLRHEQLMEGLATAAISTTPDLFSSQELANVLWSFASLQFQHVPLLQSFEPVANAQIAEVCTQNLVNTVWAIESLRRQDVHHSVLPATLGRFLQTCDGSLGIEWVTLAALADEAEVSQEVDAFIESFRIHALEPALERLRALRSANGEHELSMALREFQDWVHDVQWPHFGGTTHTRTALVEVGAKPVTDAHFAWGSVARAEVRRVAWWSCPHAAVSSQGVVAWAAADLESETGQRIIESGRVYFADDSAEHSILVERMLQPLFLQVPRNGHAERRALVSLLRVAAASFGGLGAMPAMRGSVQLYVTHYPCISCLAVIAQFVWRLPGVRLEVDFDNAWRTWTVASKDLRANAELVVGRAL